MQAPCGCYEPASIDEDSCNRVAHMSINTRAETLAAALRVADQISFGHQDDLAYGRAWTSSWNGSSMEQWWESDIAKVCGVLPAVFGFDLGGLDRNGPENFAAHNLDGVPFSKMERWIRRVDVVGALSTCVVATRIHFTSRAILTFSALHPRRSVSMHLDNPLTSNWSAPSKKWNGAGSAWDNTPGTVAAVLDRSSATHAAYLAKLALVARFFKKIAPVPIVFRPFHEFTNDWSWWGRTACSADEFRQLWHLTVSRLRVVHGIDNLLYAWSAASNAAVAELDSRYPGDDVVDVIGVDVYGSVGQLEADLNAIGAYAARRDKLFALTEVSGCIALASHSIRSTRLVQKESEACV